MLGLLVLEMTWPWTPQGNQEGPLRASLPSQLIRSLGKTIRLPYSFFRWLLKTNLLEFSLNWTSPPIFNMKKFKLRAASEWGLGPHSAGGSGLSSFLWGGERNRASQGCSLPHACSSGLWALLWGLLPSQPPALQWGILHTHTHTHTMMFFKSLQ